MSLCVPQKRRCMLAVECTVLLRPFEYLAWYVWLVWPSAFQRAEQHAIMASDEWPVSAGYIIAACVGAAIVLAIAAAVIGAVLWVRCRLKAQAEAAASEAPQKPSAYAPAIPQPWSAHPGQGVGISEPLGLYPTHSTDPMLPGMGSPGLSRACSTEPMLHHLGGPVSSLTFARSMDMKLPVRPGRARAAAGAGREPGSASLGAPGLYQTHSAEPMLPGRTGSDMSRMYSAGELCPCSTPCIGSPWLTHQETALQTLSDAVAHTLPA